MTNLKVYHDQMFAMICYEIKGMLSFLFENPRDDFIKSIDPVLNQKIRVKNCLCQTEKLLILLDISRLIAEI
jgi:hypothetical protein